MTQPLDLLTGQNEQEDPPSYDDTSHTNTLDRGRTSMTSAHHIDPNAYNVSDSVLSEDKFTRTTTTSILSHDSDALLSFIYNQSVLPPRPVVRITGTHLRHNESISPDFDLMLNITLYIIQESGHLWSRLEVSQMTSGLVPTEHKTALVPAVALEYWARTFCEDPAPNKSFSIERLVTNWVTAFLHDQIISHIRELKFVGQVSVTFPITHSKVVVSTAPTNGQSRSGIMSYISLSKSSSSSSKDYDVVRANWPYASHPPPQGDKIDPSRKATVLDERAWWDTWRDAISSAVLLKRTGWVTMEDKIEVAMEGLPPSKTEPWGVVSSL